VIAASAGSILGEIFGFPYYVGVFGVVASVGFFVFRGTNTIEKFLSVWSFVLYANYIVFFVWCVSSFGGDIGANLSAKEMLPGWFIGGIKYGANNIGVVPAILFVVRHFETRKEAVGAGLLAGPLAILPGLFFFLAMVGQYPAVLEQTVPSIYLLDILGSRIFRIVFQIVLLGTLIETATAMIHAVNERIGETLLEKGVVMPSYMRPVIAVLLLGLTSFLARFGLIDLIAKGYGTIAWGFLFLFVIPVLTFGTYKIVTRAMSERPEPEIGAS
jgi:uncharacterized membrane protein YkvI